MRFIAGLMLCLWGQAAVATDDFVRANLISILYHELSHAIIDIEELPVFGQEEDAADVGSVLLIDMLYDEDSAVSIAYDSAFGFLAEAEETGEDVAWWDAHGPDLQRYYTLICLFVGADIDARYDIAEDLELPDERLDACEDEFALANDSWGPVFDDLTARAGNGSIRYEGGTTTLTEQLVADEVANLGDDFGLSRSLVVRVESCGEANAYYDLDDQSITICSEFETWLRTRAR